MKIDIIFILIVLITVLLSSSSGLVCKDGSSFIRNDYGFKEEVGNKTCPETMQYCEALTCTKAGRNGMSVIYWACGKLEDKNILSDWYQNYYEKNMSIPNVHCHAEFGKKDEDFGNAHFTLPPVPDGLLCFAGEEFIKLDFCEEEDHFCYLAKCTKDTEQWKTKFGCSPYDSCGFIADAEDKNATGTVNCNCKFGGKDVSKSNAEFTLVDVDFPTTMLTTKRKRKTKTFTSTTTTVSTTTENPPTMTVDDTIEAEMNPTDGNNATGCCANFGGLMIMIAVFAMANSLVVDNLLQFNAY